MSYDLKVFVYLIGFNMTLIAISGFYLVWKEGRRKRQNGQE